MKSFLNRLIITIEKAGDNSCFLTLGSEELLKIGLEKWVEKDFLGAIGNKPITYPQILNKMLFFEMN